MSKLFLKATPEMKDFQEYVEFLEQERGFRHESARDKCLLIGEEIGELFKAVREEEGLQMDSEAKPIDIADEIADVFLYLCTIANRFNIDIETAVRQKEEKNKNRVWTSS